MQCDADLGLQGLGILFLIHLIESLIPFIRQSFSDYESNDSGRNIVGATLDLAGLSSEMAARGWVVDRTRIYGSSLITILHRLIFLRMRQLTLSDPS